MPVPITWYFDFVSPFAYLQWPKVRVLAERHAVALRPILFAGVLERLGLRGPAEIPGKREFVYRFVLWRARQSGLALVFPPSHPFNPLAALRLCIAAGSTPEAVEAIFDWIWRQGRGADDARQLQAVASKLGIVDAVGAVADPVVKAQLRANFDAAMAEGVFGVPTLSLGEERLFWGDDAHDFALACLDDPAMLDDPEMRRLAHLPVGVRRDV
jgi:2-hydroxychromene-2-carboxylate isomerase